MTKQIIKDLIKDGRLVPSGVLLLDGKVIFSPTVQEGNADEYGFLPPETDFGGQQNEKVNALREEWSKSDDALKRKAIQISPKLIVAMTEQFNPPQSSGKWTLVWFNNNMYFLSLGKNIRLFPFHDLKNNEIDGHLFLAGRNATWPSSDLHDDLLEGIGDYYLQYLELVKSNLRQKA